MRGSGGLALVGMLLAVCACSSQERADAPAPLSSLRKVTLPDLSHASPSVQDQLREGDAVLSRSIDTPGIRPASRLVSRSRRHASC